MSTEPFFVKNFKFFNQFSILFKFFKTFIFFKTFESFEKIDSFEKIGNVLKKLKILKMFWKFLKNHFVGQNSNFSAKEKVEPQTFVLEGHPSVLKSTL